MAAIGIQTIRQTFDWSTIERRRGRLRLLVSRCVRGQGGRARHPRSPGAVQPAGLLPPDPWARRLPTAKDGDLRALREGRRAPLRAAGGRCGGSTPTVPKNPITAYQIWNEPNLQIYWCNRRPERRDGMWRCCARSAGRSRAWTAGRRSSRPDIPPSKLKSAVPIERYMAQMYRAGARRYFDSLAINSYARNQGELRGLLQIDPAADEPPRRPARAALDHGDRLGRPRAQAPVHRGRGGPGAPDHAGVRA